MATKEQIKRIYGLGAGLGIVGKDKDDMLHELIFSITGKDSVKQLDDSEFKAVQAELINRMKLADPNHLLHNTKSRNKKKEAEEIGCNGMATPEQQRLCWRYCYRLKELDTNPESADVGDRLIGVIGKVLGVTASKKQPFRWIDQEQCSKLIEQLKRYVNSAERRAKRQEICRNLIYTKKTLLQSSGIFTTASAHRHTKSLCSVTVVCQFTLQKLILLSDRHVTKRYAGILTDITSSFLSINIICLSARSAA